MTSYLAHGQLLVIETEDDAYLGTAEVTGDTLIVRNGFVGRPTVLPVDEVLLVMLASEHPLVESTL